jgi:hypothetical protein
MSDSHEQEASVLGKRIRNAEDPASNGSEDGGLPHSVEENDSDDDFGPMPLPADGALKKKRRGALNITLRSRWTLRNTGNRFQFSRMKSYI